MMSFFKRLSGLFTAPSRPEKPVTWITVKCNRCGEIIKARIDLHNDLSINYGEREEDTTYFCRKMLMGSRQCYQQVEVELTFDSKRNLVQKEIRGGTFIEETKA